MAEKISIPLPEIATAAVHLSGLPAKLDLLIDAVVDYAIYMLDPEGFIVTWNKGAQRLMGYGAPEVIGKHFSMFYPPEDRGGPRPALELQEAARTGRFKEEGWRVRKDGSRMWVNVVLTPIHNEQGDLLGFAEVTRDISERQTMIEQLRQSEERFRLFVQSVKDYAIFMLMPDGTIASWNEGAERAKGYTAAEAIGKHFSMFYTPEDRAAGRPEELLEAARIHGRVEDEGWRVRKDGSRFRVDVVITAVHDPQGELRGFTKVTRDVTERHKSEELIQEKQRQIIELQKMEAIGRLAGGIAHDFNNLLAGIMGSTEALQDVVMTEAQEETEEILKACQRGRQLTQQLLAFSRRQIARPITLNVNDVVQDLQRMLARLIGTDISLELGLATHLPTVKMDLGQLQQIILNLVLNARDSISQGGRISIQTRTVTMDELSTTSDFQVKPGDYVMIAITDNGAGMSRDIQQRIFEPFFTTKEMGKGTGLGLATVYGILQQHSGGVAVYSLPGHGTTFKVFLPVNAPNPEDKKETLRASQEDAALRGTETILIAEDDALVLRNTVRSLQARGYTVLPATDGAEALRLAEKAKGKIDLLITDIIMPNQNGKQLADALHKFSPHLPVIYMSGYSADLIADHGILSEKVTFLEKPFTSVSLAQKVRELLGKK